MAYKILLMISVFTLLSCKGPRVAPPPPEKLGPKIPDELARAFEVKDVLELPALLQTPKIEEKREPAKKHSKRSKQNSKKPEVKPENISAKMPLPTLDGLVIPNRRPTLDPIWVGEKICMDVTWLSATAGEICLEVLPFKYIKNRKVYEIKGIARTSKLFSLFYKAEDSIQTYIDYTGWFPYKFTLHGDESKHIRNNLELFDHVAQKQYVWAYDYRTQSGEVHENKDIKPLTRFSQDSLSSLYYIRTHKITPDSSIRFPMTTGGEQWETEVRILKREDIKTPMGTKSALKTRVETRFYGGLRQQGDAFIWFSDDDKRYPLRFEAKVKIGWIAGITKSIQPGTAEPPTYSAQTQPGSGQ